MSDEKKKEEEVVDKEVEEQAEEKKKEEKAPDESPAPFVVNHRITQTEPIIQDTKQKKEISQLDLLVQVANDVIELKENLGVTKQ